MKKLNRSKLNGIYDAAVTLVSNKTRAIANKIAKLARKAKDVCVGILSKRVPHPAPRHRVFCHHHPLPLAFFSRFSFRSLNVPNTICTAKSTCALLLCVVLLYGCKSMKTVERSENMTSDINLLQTIDRGTTNRYSRDISAILDNLALRNVAIRITDFKEDGQGMATVERVTEITVDSVGAERAQARRSEGAESSDTLEANMALSETIAAETKQKTEEQPQKANCWRAAKMMCAIIVFVLVVVLMLRVWKLKGGFLAKIIKWLFF